MIPTALICAASCLAAAEAELPLIEVTRDDTVITKSCRVRIRPGAAVEDVNGNGVIVVGASDVTVEFVGGSVLRGAKAGVRPDEYTGCGIRIDGHKNVTIRGAKLSGYRCGLWATKADGLTLDGVDASDNRRAFLKSTPLAEDGADWLHPHRNDGNEWLTHYAAAIYVEDSSGVVVRNCRVRLGQNALCLDRVTAAKVYDNDFSFNSGWGVAMWRSSKCLVSRNALDFCIRGYSHGVYNRGQDSAGLLMFEQNNGNVIAENSITHGGDGVFGFGGLEALGDVGKHPQAWHRRRGNNDNLFVGNDLSYAAAHGLEMTFSFGNRVIDNRLVGNAICGIWGGYSQQTLVAGNRFGGNGEMGYGLERGGVNIEHGRDNRIVGNRFEKDRCGVHLWWDNDAGLLKKVWAAANRPDSTDNLIAGNELIDVAVTLHFRGRSDVTVAGNTVRGGGKQIAEGGAAVTARGADDKLEAFEKPTYHPLGRTRPVGARPTLRGRQNIIMTEWGPWDHASPLVRLVEGKGEAVTYDLHKMPGKVRVALEGAAVAGKLSPAANDGAAPRYTIRATKPGIRPYAMRVRAGAFEKTITGTLLAAKWQATFFKWPTTIDPRKDLPGWRKLAAGAGAVGVEIAQMKLSYGYGGPSEQKLSARLTDAKLGGDHFGMVAKTRLPLPAGKWRFRTFSDDGVRVTADGKAVIENWTWHGPTRNEGTLELPAGRTVEIVVEHFEIDGYATFELEIDAVK